MCSTILFLREREKEMDFAFYERKKDHALFE
jgi:hypothetical protein